MQDMTLYSSTHTTSANVSPDEAIDRDSERGVGFDDTTFPDQEVASQATLDIAAYDAVQREAARAAGHPTQRTHTPGVVPQPPAKAGEEYEPMPFTYVWVDPTTNAVLYAGDEFSPVPQRLNASALFAMFNDEDSGPGRVVVPDAATARRLLVATQTAVRRSPEGSEQHDQARSLERQLKVLTRLPYSSLLVVLTRALSRRYWLPCDLSEESIDDWSKSLDAPHFSTSPLAAMSALLNLASNGVSSVQATNAMFYGELSAVRSSFYPGTRSSNAAYQAVAGNDVGADAWDRLDMGLLHRNVLDGSVSRLNVVDVDWGQFAFTAHLSQPFRLKTDKELLVMSPADGGTPAHASLVSVQVTSDALVAMFQASRPSSRSPRARALMHLVGGAIKDEEPLYATEKPYFPVAKRRDSSSPSKGRWVSGGSVAYVDHGLAIPSEIARAMKARARN